jgi:hypothetical protein
VGRQVLHFGEFELTNENGAFGLYGAGRSAKISVSLQRAQIARTFPASHWTALGVAQLSTAPIIKNGIEIIWVSRLSFMDCPMPKQ